MEKNYLNKFHAFVLLLIIFSFSSCSSVLNYNEDMSSIEMINAFSRGISNARITVGVIQNGQMSYTVYGENGRVLPNREYTYDIGSCTKAITGHLFAKAIHENLIALENIDDQIDQYLDLPKKEYYPTIRRLLTHTSGYGYFREDTLQVLFPPLSTPYENPHYGLTKKMVIDHIGSINLENRDYEWVYSNFGLSVAGLVLESIFNEDYSSLVERYFKSLGLNNTSVSDGKSDLSYSWDWNDGNPFIAAGGVASTITDMMKFIEMQMDESLPYVEYAHKVWANDVNTEMFPTLKGRVNAIGLAWWISSGINVIEHGGSTQFHTTYMGFSKDRGIGVVVLTNIYRDETMAGWSIGAKKILELLE